MSMHEKSFTYKGEKNMDQVQVHVASWSITLALFIVSLILIKTGPEKAQKIIHMILRLFLLITFLTGVGIVFAYGFGAAYIKGALGTLLLIFMEMILLKTRDHDKTALLWVVFAVDIILVFYYGYVVI